MKRLALLAISAFMALLLSACGDNAEKKVEGQATQAVEQSDSNATTTPDAKPQEEAAPTQSNDAATNSTTSDNAASDAAKPE